jgi:hypothetical protein
MLLFRANHRPPSNIRGIAPICCVAKFSYLHLGYAGKEGRSLRQACRGSRVANQAVGASKGFGSNNQTEKADGKDPFTIACPRMILFDRPAAV